MVYQHGTLIFQNLDTLRMKYFKMWSIPNTIDWGNECRPLWFQFHDFNGLFFVSVKSIVGPSNRAHHWILHEPTKELVDQYLFGLLVTCSCGLAQSIPAITCPIIVLFFLFSSSLRLTILRLERLPSQY